MVDAPQPGPHSVRMRPAGVLAAVAVLTLTAGCSSDQPTATQASKSDSAPTASQSPTKKVAAPLLDQYMKALAKNSAGPLTRAGRKLAAPGSLAAAYAKQMVDGIAAYTDAGQDAGDGSGQKLTSAGGGYKLCQGKTCYRYTEFKVDGKGRVASLAVNGKPLAGRVLLGGGSTSHSSLGDVRLLSSFITTATGDLIVHLRITSKDKLLTLGYETTYKTPAGVQRTMSNSVAAQDLAIHSVETVELSFKGPLKLGGTLNLKLEESDGNGGYGGDLAENTVVIRLAS